MKVLVVRSLKYAGMALYPFILVNRPEFRLDTVLIRHEQIHLKQQREMLVLPFYVVYLLCYLFNLLRYRDHDRAYLQIPFEREAYLFEADKNYLARRKFWAWLSV